MLRTVRSKIILLGVAALILSLGISLPLELLAGRRDSQLATRQEFTRDILELIPVIDVLQSNAEAPQLLGSLFRRLGRTEELYVLAPDGRIVSSTQAGMQGGVLQDLHVPLPPDAAGLLVHTGPPVVRTVSAPRNPGFTEVFARLSGGDTLLAVSSPGASSALRHLLLYHTIPPLLLAVLLLGGIVWVGLNRLIMRPLGLLAQSSESVVSRDNVEAGIIPPELIPGDDVGEVLRLRNLMLQRLQATRLRLEDQLNQRTFELEVTRHVSGQLGHFGTDQELLREVLVRLNQVVSWDVAAGFLVEAGQARVWAQSQNPVSPGVALQVRGWLEEACPSGGREHARVLRGLWDSTAWAVSEAGGPLVEQLGSRLAFPLQVDEGFAGSVVLCAVQTNAYAGHHQRIIREVLEQGLNAIGRTRRLVAAQARRLETVLQGMSVGIVILDAEDRIVYVNRRGTQYLARLEEPGGLVGVHWRSPGMLSGLFGQEREGDGHDGQRAASRVAAQGTLRVTLAPFAGEAGDVRDGRLVIIEAIEPNGQRSSGGAALRTPDSLAP